jgi:hypothetical protein
MAEQIGEGKKLAELEPEITRFNRLSMQRAAVPAHMIPCEPLAPVKVIAEGLWAIANGMKSTQA